MSWEAVKWAMDQDPGNSEMKLVLIGTCNWANKRTNKIYAKAETVADWCNLKDPRVVNKRQKQLCAGGFLLDTGERTGGNGRVPVYKPGWDKLITNSQLTHDKLITNSQLTASHAVSFIGKVGLNPEPGTLNHKPEKRAEGNPLPSGKRPLAPILSSIFSGIPSPKAETNQYQPREPEPPFWDEARQLGASDEEIKRIKKWFRDKGKEPTRAFVLNILKKNPPGSPSKRKRRKIAPSPEPAPPPWDPQLAKSIADGIREHRKKMASNPT